MWFFKISDTESYAASFPVVLPNDSGGCRYFMRSGPAGPECIILRPGEDAFLNAWQGELWRFLMKEVLARSQGAKKRTERVAMLGPSPCHGARRQRRWVTAFCVKAPLGTL